MGECPGDRVYDKPEDHWGSPACDNREPAQRTRRVEPVVAARRFSPHPVVNAPHYEVRIDVETVSGRKFSFETEMDSKWDLEEIDQVAKERAKSECAQVSAELESYEIKSLVLV